MTSPTAVQPATFSMSITEIQTLQFDPTAYLSSGQRVSSPAVSLTRMSDGSPATPTYQPVVTGNLITQVLDGPNELDVNAVYRLRVTFTAAPSVNVWAMDLVVTVTP